MSDHSVSTRRPGARGAKRSFSNVQGRRPSRVPAPTSVVAYGRAGVKPYCAVSTSQESQLSPPSAQA